MSIKLCDGKYEFYLEPSAFPEHPDVLRCKRHGKEWPAGDEILRGSNSLRALFNHAVLIQQESERLRIDSKRRDDVLCAMLADKLSEDQKYLWGWQDARDQVRALIFRAWDKLKVGESAAALAKILREVDEMQSWHPKVP